MIRITYVGHDGNRHPVELDAGMTLMEGATLNLVPGVEALCGGMCSCGTCHCYIPAALAVRLPPPGQVERELLTGALHPREASRLGCQVIVTAEFEGTEIGLPASQGQGTSP